MSDAYVAVFAAVMPARWSSMCLGVTNIAQCTRRPACRPGHPAGALSRLLWRSRWRPAVVQTGTGSAAEGFAARRTDLTPTAPPRLVERAGGIPGWRSVGGLVRRPVRKVEVWCGPPRFQRPHRSRRHCTAGRERTSHARDLASGCWHRRYSAWGVAAGWFSGPLDNGVGSTDHVAPPPGNAGGVLAALRLGQIRGQAAQRRALVSGISGASSRWISRLARDT
jgi:hypothetical protein